MLKYTFSSSNIDFQAQIQRNIEQGFQRQRPSFLCPIFRERRFEGVDPGIVTIQQRLEASFGEKAAEAEDTEAALVSSWGPAVGVARSGAEQPGLQESSYG